MGELLVQLLQLIPESGCCLLELLPLGDHLLVSGVRLVLLL